MLLSRNFDQVGGESTFTSLIPETETTYVLLLKAGLLYTGSFRPVRATL